MSRRLVRTGTLADDWRASASCQGLDTDLFFPPGTAGGGWVALAEVQRICGGCPVRQACLHWAIAADVSDGIWGGLTPLERRAHRLRQKRR